VSPTSAMAQLDPERVQQWLAQITKDPEQCRHVLQSAGLITESGELTEPYRPEPEQP
jgi:hypothetical protein